MLWLFHGLLDSKVFAKRFVIHEKAWAKPFGCAAIRYAKAFPIQRIK